MYELLKILVNKNENRNWDTNEIDWDFVDADAWQTARKHYDTDEAYFAAFDAAADRIEFEEIL